MERKQHVTCGVTLIKVCVDQNVYVFHRKLVYYWYLQSLLLLMKSCCENQIFGVGECMGEGLQVDIEDWNRRELCYTCSQNSKCVTIGLLVINKQDVVTLVISKTHIHISSKTSFMYSDFRIFQLHRKCQVLARKPPAISKYSLNCLTLVSLEPFYIDSF